MDRTHKIIIIIGEILTYLQNMLDYEVLIGASGQIFSAAPARVARSRPNDSYPSIVPNARRTSTVRTGTGNIEDLPGTNQVVPPCALLGR